MVMTEIDAGCCPLGQGQLPYFYSGVALGIMRTMARTLIDRIDERMNATGLTDRGASVKAGLSPDFVRTLRRRPDAHPRSDTLSALAAALECDVRFLIGEVDAAGAPNPAATAWQDLPILHKVAAGAWRAVDEDDQRGPKTYPAFRLPQYAHCQQWLEEVEGDSADRFIPPGALAHAVSAIDMGYEPRHGDFVIVVRTRAQGSVVERTIKQIELRPKGVVELWPRSHNPRWNAPIVLHEGVAENEDIEVTIAAKVVQAYMSFSPT